MNWKWHQPPTLSMFLTINATNSSKKHSHSKNDTHKLYKEIITSVQKTCKASHMISKVMPPHAALLGAPLDAPSILTLIQFAKGGVQNTSMTLFGGGGLILILKVLRSWKSYISAIALCLNNLSDKETFKRIDIVQTCQGRKISLNLGLFLALHISTMVLTQTKVRRNLEILANQLYIFWTYKQSKQMCLVHSTWFLHKLHIKVMKRPILTHDQCSFSSRLKFLIMGEDANFKDGWSFNLGENWFKNKLDKKC